MSNSSDDPKTDHIVVGQFSTRQYACKKGHTYQAHLPIDVRFTNPGSNHEEVEASTGPLCPYCLTKFFRDTCGAELVVPEVPPTDKS